MNPEVGMLIVASVSGVGGGVLVKLIYDGIKSPKASNGITHLIEDCPFNKDGGIQDTLTKIEKSVVRTETNIDNLEGWMGKIDGRVTTLEKKQMR